MGFCRADFHGSKFEAYVNVIGNPGATVTLGNDKYNYYCTCDSNGNGNITINRRQIPTLGECVNIIKLVSFMLMIN